MVCRRRVVRVLAINEHVQTGRAFFTLANNETIHGGIH